MRKMKKDLNALGTAVVIIIAAMVIATTAIAVLYMLPPADDGGNGGQNGDENDVDELFYILITGRDGEAINMSLAQMKELGNVSGSAKAQNRFGNWGGEGIYEGIKISSIITSISGGMNPGDVLRITSEDGYYQDFTYYNVYPDGDWHQMQGDFILAYSFNGTEAPEWDEGLKLVSLPPDGEYSQQDCNWTSAVGQGYNNNPSAGARWVRNVASMEITAGEMDWSITLFGDGEKVLSKTEFEMYKNWYPEHYVDGDGKNWSGVSLANLIGLVDGGDMRGENAYDPGYLPETGSEGYDVNISAEDGFTRYFDNTQISSLILADMVNGTTLISSQGPLRLIAPGMRTGNWVRQVSEISIEPKWDLHLEGWDHEEWEYNNQTLRYSELLKMDPVSGVAYAYKVSYPHLPIEGPFNFTGILLMDLVSKVWNISYDFTLEIEANDGYITTLNSSEAAGNITTYDMDKNSLGVQPVSAILAFEREGERWFNSGPLRLVFVNETGAVTDMGLWNKFVKTLRVIEKVEDWEVVIEMNMTGKAASSVAFSRSEFEHAFHKAHSAAVTLGEDLYEGIPLWILLGVVDGNDTYDGANFYHWGF
ncbi:MAG: molybdopterin-dependent oxidoreductase, partial [Candidatus Thermoplasmatota archaeon]|nr:molybdopterin-dependent oxidoreductase [Candidatus Thermoplasmatota archaeon]